MQCFELGVTALRTKRGGFGRIVSNAYLTLADYGREAHDPGTIAKVSPQGEKSPDRDQEECNDGQDEELRYP